MIGLVDYSLQTSASTTFLEPNIEIMKLATYYRTEEKQFCRLINLNETELNSYDKIFFFTEHEPSLPIPEQFLRANNVIFGGTGFTNGKYIPFENEIIDYTIPRPSIYKDFLKNKYNEGIKTKVIEHVLDDTYYRNYAGINKLPFPPVLPRKRIILYDKDFFYPDWEETMQIFTDRKCSTIIRVHPIVCRTLSEYFDARKFIKLNRANDFILDINIPLQEIGYMIKYYMNLFLADINTSSNVYIPIGGTWPTYLQYSRDIVYKLNLLYSFWSHGVPLKIKYIQPRIGSINPFFNLIKLIEAWANGKNEKSNPTILDKIPKKDRKKGCIENDQYEMLLKYMPSAKTLFNCKKKTIIEGGSWIV